MQYTLDCSFGRFSRGIVALTLPKDTSIVTFVIPSIAMGTCHGHVDYLPFTSDDSCTASSSKSGKYL